MADALGNELKRDVGEATRKLANAPEWQGVWKCALQKPPAATGRLVGRRIQLTLSFHKQFDIHSIHTFCSWRLQISPPHVTLCKSFQFFYIFRIVNN
jgi:hypothetical protein